MDRARARSMDEFVDGLRRAVLQVGDLHDGLEYEIEDMARFPVFLDPLENGIRALCASTDGGACSFGREDPPFMDLASKYAEEIPFHTLLKQIDETHRRGLDLGDDND